MTDDVEVTEHDDGFIYFRLTGQRFAAPGMPADSVVEVQRLSELVYEVARSVWLEHNQDRQRVPSELVRAFDLRLVSVDEGSAMPVLRLAYSGPTAQDEEDFGPVFAQARSIVVDTVASVADDFVVPDDFPRDALPYLKRLGKTIKAEESLQLAEPRPPSARSKPPTRIAVLDTQVQETIKTIDAALDSDPGPQQIEGVITELDGARGTFQLRDEWNDVRVCRLAYNEPELAETVKSVLAADGITAPDVRVSGVGVRDRRDRIGDLWDVDQVEIVRSAEEKVLVTKLSVIAELEDGWWGTGTVAPDAEVLHAARALLPDLALADVHVALTASDDGAIVLQWRRGSRACTAHIEPEARMFLCADDTVTDQVREFEGPFDGPSLMRFVYTGELG